MLLHRSHYELAKHVLYNHGKTVAETSKELIESLRKAQRFVIDGSTGELKLIFRTVTDDARRHHREVLAGRWRT